MNIQEIRNLENLIGYQFADKALLTQAVTHPSFGSGKSDYSHNQRLEFLGDSVLGSVLASWIFSEFPKDKEGEMSKKKAMLARGGNLAAIARKIRLEKFIKASLSEFCHETGFRDSLLEDAIEAIIGAVFLDGGYEKACNVISKWIPLFQETLEGAPSRFNPKGQLQESLQAKSKKCRIAYRIISETGPDHKKKFTVELIYNGRNMGKGVGPSKRLAEENAAQILLTKINSI